MDFLNTPLLPELLYCVALAIACAVLDWRRKAGER